MNSHTSSGGSRVVIACTAATSLVIGATISYFVFGAPRGIDLVADNGNTADWVGAVGSCVAAIAAIVIGVTAARFTRDVEGQRILENAAQVARDSAVEEQRRIENEAQVARDASYIDYRKADLDALRSREQAHDQRAHAQQEHQRKLAIATLKVWAAMLERPGIFLHKFVAAEAEERNLSRLAGMVTGARALVNRIPWTDSAWRLLYADEGVHWIDADLSVLRFSEFCDRFLASNKHEGVFVQADAPHFELLLEAADAMTNAAANIRKSVDALPPI